MFLLVRRMPVHYRSHPDIVVIVTEIHWQAREDGLCWSRWGHDSAYVGDPVIADVEPSTICGVSSRAVGGLGGVHGDGSSGLRGGVVDDVVDTGVAVHGSNWVP